MGDEQKISEHGREAAGGGREMNREGRELTLEAWGGWRGGVRRWRRAASRPRVRDE